MATSEGALARPSAAEFKTPSPRQLALAISRLEAGSSLDAMRSLAPERPNCWVIGITGPERVGKITTVAALLDHACAGGARVGQLCSGDSGPAHPRGD